ncbi:uncharacterized protein LOC109791647 isoform X1 [Cajanus cajan]|uniref:uncharacterized protein LOC109791647 isoform X1 n=1 Tax=Cajanus cajan TaxID=3821 RepID=UPI0010FB3035|nr:uncharacterized protein LOC109791647 isoform X1 [Cajanus cajan]
MEAVAASSLSMLSLGSMKTRSRVTRNCHVTPRKGCDVWVKSGRRRRTRVGAVNVEDVTTVLDRAPVEVTWQIVVGTIAGVTPFVVAGIEFSKRIAGFFLGNPGKDSSPVNFYSIVQKNHTSISITTLFKPRFYVCGNILYRTQM